MIDGSRVVLVRSGTDWRVDRSLQKSGWLRRRICEERVAVSRPVDDASMAIAQDSRVEYFKGLVLVRARPARVEHLIEEERAV